MVGIVVAANTQVGQTVKPLQRFKLQRPQSVNEEGKWDLGYRGGEYEVTALWDTAPCSLAEADRHFTDPYCLHRQIALMMEAVSFSKKKIGQLLRDNTAVISEKGEILFP
jgi:hypothetical protein